MGETKARIGLLGAGAMGEEHAGVYAEFPDVEVVGVFSRDLGRAKAVAALCGARAFDDAAALIGTPGLDAIDVCLPSRNHREVVIAALDQGRHVFCETPMALDLGDARAMAQAARRAGRLLQVGLLMRSVGPYEHVKAVQASGRYGRLLSLTTYRLGSYLRAGAPDHKSHYSDPSTELMTFDFDFVQWLMGVPARLTASAAGGDGEISALLSYGDGRHATVIASGLMPRGYPFSVGFRALFEAAAFELQNVFEDGPPVSKFTLYTHDGPPEAVTVPGRNPYAVELRRFVDCIGGRADPELLDAQRAIEALALSDATQRALAEARSIDLVG
jgi:UDP-N-acetylglucosamine 3-dehydrogenase